MENMLSAVVLEDLAQCPSFANSFWTLCSSAMQEHCQWSTCAAKWDSHEFQFPSPYFILENL